MARKTIGDRIKKIREEAGLTQYDFGDTLGLSREMVNALERDRFEPRVEILRAIKKKYKMSYDWLLDGEK